MTVTIVGGDARQRYAAEELTRLGYSVTEMWNTTSLQDIGGADILLLPIPATRDGIHLNCNDPAPPRLCDFATNGAARIFGGGFSAQFISEMRHSGREVTDLLSLNGFTEENAALTAEAALGIGMRATGKSLRGLNIGVIGYGRIASRLTRLLLLLGAHVSVFARNESARLAARLDGAQPYDTVGMRQHLTQCCLLYNTVPAILLDRQSTDLMSDCAIVELASGKENIFISPKAQHVTLTYAHSLPGKIFPVSAGHMIAHTLDQTMKKEGFMLK